MIVLKKNPKNFKLWEDEYNIYFSNYTYVNLMDHKIKFRKWCADSIGWEKKLETLKEFHGY